MPEKDIDVRATHAKRLMDDPYLQEAFDLIRQVVHQQFEELNPIEVATYPVTEFGILALRLQILDSVWDNLEQAVREQKYEAQKPISILGDLNGGQSRNH